ncbi:MAG: serine hydrolase domain-containing protein [Spirochaetota bacterium]
MNLEKAGISGERLERIRPAIEKHIGDKKIAGAVTLVYRRGERIHLESYGQMDRGRRKPMQADTIFRIYSMTKPIISTALMMLFEQGHFQLFDAVSKFIPAFKNLKVFKRKGASGIEMVDLEREVTIHDLFTHTSGLTYHFLENGPVEEMYREAKICAGQPLEEFIFDLLKMPLAFQPGECWRYSFSVDVLAHLIEIMSGEPLDSFLESNLFTPLGMMDTGYYVPKDKLSRFTAEYGSLNVLNPDMTVSKCLEDAEKGINTLISDPFDCPESRPHNVLRGGHGLVSTAADYLQFCRMLLNRGELDGTRFLSPKTVELMLVNHLEPRLMPLEIGGNYLPGYGWGLGFRVLMDVGQCLTAGTIGEFGWAGAANTYFWIDPKEEFIGILMAQFQPSGYYLIANDFRVLAYQSIVE